MAEPFTVPHFRSWASELILDTGEPWEVEPFQIAFIRDLFRGFLEAWFVVPEGNAKTTLAGGLALYYALFRPDAMVTIAASARDQAMWLYDSAAGFVARTPGIEDLFRCQEGFRRIRCDSMRSRVQIYSADDRTGDGARPTLAILEELHRHRDLRLYRTWRGKVEKRGGQVVAISTAGDPAEEFESVRRKMRSEGKVTRRGAYLRAATEHTVLHDYSVIGDVEKIRDVKAANPLRAITIETLRNKRSSPAMTRSHWRRFVGNIPSGLEDQPISPEDWDRLRVDIGALEDGEEVVLVPSVGRNAAVAIAARRSDDRIAVAAEILEADDDSIYRLTEEKIRELCRRYDVLEIRHPMSGFVRSSEILSSEGYPMLEDPHSPQRMAAASGTFNRLLRAGLLMHDGDEMLRAHVLAATTKTQETGERYITADESRAITAVAMAVHAVTVFELEPVVFLSREA